MKKFFLKNLKILLIATSLAVTVLLGILLGVILVYQKGFPQIKNLEDIKPVVMTTLYDDQNTPIKDFAIEKRIIVKSTDIPTVLKNALVAAEDNQFYSHWGINFRGFIRAVGGVLLHKKWGGGSSITQQLARGLFLTPEFSISRKLQEMLLAIQIEKKYTKDQILTFYCNKIFLGGSIYGVEAAARYYFGKSVREINPAEAALIAGIVPNPNGHLRDFQAHGERPEAAELRAAENAAAQIHRRQGIPGSAGRQSFPRSPSTPATNPWPIISPRIRANTWKANTATTCSTRAA